MEAEYDVVIAGAGLSGIAAGYYLQTYCPELSFVIVEARETMGGTWDLFRYPGLRSDSDMYTFGFSFRPWRDRSSIARGDLILQYLQDTAHEFGVDKKIQYNTRVEGLDWSSRDAAWQLKLRDGRSKQSSRVKCRFFWACTGYYRYESGYTPEFEGVQDFSGELIHPQHWPENLDYSGKKIVIIGSGATAVTLAPVLAKTAASVAVLQRSPSYVLSVPGQDPVAKYVEDRLSPERAHKLVRRKNVLVGMLFYQWSRRYPEAAKRFLRKQLEKSLGEDYDTDPHFAPKYNPWDQRLCLVPDADLFRAIRAGAVEMVTDHIERFEARGIRTRSGRLLEADIVVTATGLVLQFLGGAELYVDGKAVVPSEAMMYKGTMLSGVPNMAFCVGYTNASWTLKVELTCRYVCGLLKHMREKSLASCVPRLEPGVESVPVIDFSSGYVQRGLASVPSQGSRWPWRLYQNYILDRLTLLRSPDDGVLEFS